MKKFISLSAVVFLVFNLFTTTSCTKTETVTVTDTVVKYLPTPTTVAGLLLSKQWIVDSLYNGYDATHPGSRVYARGASNNQQNLDNYIVIFWPDGTQVFASNGVSTGSYQIFSYQFKSADSLNLLINNPGPDYARIVRLDATHLTIYDSTNSALSYYNYKP